MLKYLIAALVLIAPTSLHAQGVNDKWVEKGGDHDTVISWRVKDILAGSPTSTRATLWARMAESDGSYALIKNEVNCVTGMSRMVFVAMYSPEGEVTDKSSRPEAWSPIIPNSNESQVTNLLCMSADDFNSWLNDGRTNTPARFDT